MSVLGEDRPRYRPAPPPKLGNDLALRFVPELPYGHVIDAAAAALRPPYGRRLQLGAGLDRRQDAVIGVKDAAVLAFLPQPRELALPLTCVAHLVASDGSQETLLFGTSSEKALEKFKEELWALDEFAGVRLRDPADPELLDIGLHAQLGPLRRILGSRLATVGATPVSQLRTWTVRHTVYQAADAVRALHAMVSAGEVRRSPAAGRLNATTVIEPVPAPPAYVQDGRSGAVSRSGARDP